MWQTDREGRERMFSRLIEREERRENVWQTDREGRERMCGRLVEREERRERKCLAD